MNPSLWIAFVRTAGALHLITLALAYFTPVPRDWDANLQRLTNVHRRFAIAQNVAIGGVIAFLGLACLFLGGELASGSPSARALCLAISLWWGGRLLILPWLHVWSELPTTALRLGFVALHLECATFALGFGWLASTTR
jgi:hypothetical protein